MMVVLLEVILPAIGLLIASFAASLYRKIQYPSPLALGCIIPRVCVVGSEEILRYNKAEVDQSVARHLRRQVLWKRFRVNWGFLRQETWNTALFQRAVRFEKMKIDPAKSALEYEQREILILELISEAAELRWKLFRSQGSLLFRVLVGLTIDQEVLITLLGEYKQLEEDIVALAGMAEEDFYREMLVERLGLGDWGLIQGGASGPS